ncbi:hypothetical protein NXH76_23715 [Blautia schinkii]|nr:hypothetical protein [Blautia schinkii]
MSKKIKRRLGVVFLVATMCMPTVSVIASVEEVNSVAVANEIETRGPAYEWRYKIIDGKLYKRYYNIKSGKYEGNWILVQ